MDDDRKYKQRGYMESERDSQAGGKDRFRQKGQRLPLDVTGPRLPRLVQSVAAARCYNCATPLPADADFRGNCPKCSVPLHCCKQCGHFEPSTRFQCLKPIPARIAAKDQANECEWFEPRVTVARDVTPNGSSISLQSPAPKGPNEARAAFDNLFKK